MQIQFSEEILKELDEKDSGFHAIPAGIHKALIVKATGVDAETKLGFMKKVIVNFRLGTGDYFSEDFIVDSEAIRDRNAPNRKWQVRSLSMLRSIMGIAGHPTGCQSEDLIDLTLTIEISEPYGTGKDKTYMRQSLNHVYPEDQYEERFADYQKMNSNPHQLQQPAQQPQAHGLRVVNAPQSQPIAPEPPNLAPVAAPAPRPSQDLRPAMRRAASLHPDNPLAAQIQKAEAPVEMVADDEYDPDSLLNLGN